ncbi:hypothetical protein [Sphingobacterium sp. 2149]|uniref:hypothetical protein n=1 Tax=Sphingobacterium sp. 2149 TaxID=2817763 RepID=UPI002860E640|nr:hypothetical protein [Sphingobacterium sp. 2149]MDR6734198.1 hypothetical protein [Sphingobacterium sp. 2149]
MAKPKYDYESDQFKERIEELARRGYTDKEIALELELNPNYFSELKNNNDCISEPLKRARAKVNATARQKYLALSMGLLKKKTVTRKLPSKFEEDSYIDPDGLVVYETIEELPPDRAGLERWLYNHDEDWRKTINDSKRLDITSDGKEINANPLVFVSASELSEDQLQGLIKAQIGEDINADSSNDTGS